MSPNPPKENLLVSWSKYYINGCPYPHQEKISWSRGGFLNQLSISHYHFCPYPHQEKISWSRGGFGNKVSRTLSHDQNYVCPPPHNEKISWSRGEKKMEICPYLNKNKNKLSCGKKILDAPTPTRRKSLGLVVDSKTNCVKKYNMTSLCLSISPP